jgi:hypothetical protein
LGEYEKIIEIMRQDTQFLTDTERERFLKKYIRLMLAKMTHNLETLHEKKSPNKNGFWATPPVKDKKRVFHSKSPRRLKIDTGDAPSNPDAQTKTKTRPRLDSNASMNSIFNDAWDITPKNTEKKIGFDTADSPVRRNRLESFNSANSDLIDNIHGSNPRNPRKKSVGMSSVSGEDSFEKIDQFSESFVEISYLEENSFEVLSSVVSANTPNLKSIESAKPSQKDQFVRFEVLGYTQPKKIDFIENSLIANLLRYFSYFKEDIKNILVNHRAAGALKILNSPLSYPKKPTKDQNGTLDQEWIEIDNIVESVLDQNLIN